jgi:hypothetical protein
VAAGASIYGLLHTAFGSAVSVDLASHAASHSSEPGAPRNVVLAPEGDAAHLVVFDPHTGRTAGCLVGTADGSLRLAQMSGTPHWRLEMDDTWVTLTGPAGQLTAKRGGTLAVGAASGDPRLTILSSLTCQCLDALRGRVWIHQSGRELDTTVRLLPRPSLRAGGQDIDLTGLPGPFIIHQEPHSAAPIRQLHLRGPNGRLHRVALFNPVICLAIFGSDYYYEVLSLALAALHEFGEYTGTVCVCADRRREHVEPWIPECYRATWRYVPYAQGDNLFARYGIPDWGLEAFQPVLYVDADVVANIPLRPLLARLALSPRIHVATEDWLIRYGRPKPAQFKQMEGANWFGAWLFAEDPRFTDTVVPFGSSGIMGTDTAERFRTPFAMVRSLRQVVDPQMVHDFTDQALANYALYACGFADFTLLNGFVDYARKAEHARPERRGLMHFHAGVGQGELKRDQMRKYMDRLRGE